MPSRRALWFAAVKPPMYTVAVTPVLVGSLAAYAETGALSLRVLLTFLSAAIAIIAWLNLTNDVFDFDTGVDKNKRESVVNLCGGTRRARNAVLAIASVFLTAAFAMLALLCSLDGQFDATVLAVIGVGVMGGYMYQGPPFRLGYYGLGEPICFFAWAISVAAAFYSQLRLHASFQKLLMSETNAVSHRVSFLLLDLLWSRDHYLGAAALLVATPTTIILLCSHFHQVEDDLRAGKRSPIVRLGTKNGVIVLELSLVLFLFLEFYLHGIGMIPSQPFYISLLSIPYALELANFVRRNHEVPEAVRPAKYYAVKFHFVHGCLVSFGFLLAGQRKGALF